MSSRDGPGGGRAASVAGPALADLGSRLRQLAGDAAYQAGLAYFRKGVVKDGSVAGARPTPPSADRTDYRVSVACAQATRRSPRGGRTVKVTCTCPAHRRNRYCKHVVAVCTALLQALSSSSSVPPCPSCSGPGRPFQPSGAPPDSAPRAPRGTGSAPTSRSRRYAPPGWRRSSAR